mgnify:CR=1 FL=1
MTVRNYCVYISEKQHNNYTSEAGMVEQRLNFVQKIMYVFIQNDGNERYTETNEESESEKKKINFIYMNRQEGVNFRFCSRKKIIRLEKH